MREKCDTCEQMKKENAVMRKAMMETSKQYVEVVNELLTVKNDWAKALVRKANERRDNGGEQ